MYTFVVCMFVVNKYRCLGTVKVMKIITLFSCTEKRMQKSFSWRSGGAVIKIHGKADQQGNNAGLGLILSPGWRGMKGMRRFMAASSAGARGTLETALWWRKQ